MSGMILSILFIVACQLLTRARPANRAGMRQRTKKQYVRNDFFPTPRFHQSHMATEDTNCSISSQNFTLVRIVQPLNAVPCISLTAGGMTISSIDVQYPNDFFPISSSPLPRVTLVNPLQRHILRGKNPKILPVITNKIAHHQSSSPAAMHHQCASFSTSRQSSRNGPSNPKLYMGTLTV